MIGSLTEPNELLSKDRGVNIFDGFPAADRLRLPSFGFPSADWTGARNPIHAIVTVDGELIADLTADNPCLSTANGQPAANSPSNQSGECTAHAIRNGIRLAQRSRNQLRCTAHPSDSVRIFRSSGRHKIVKTSFGGRSPCPVLNQHG